MLDTIRYYTGRGLTAIGAAAMFVVMLPIAFAATVIMMFAGMIALVNLKHRLRKAGLDAQWQQAVDQGPVSGDKGRKAPIEGSYSVVKE